MKEREKICFEILLKGGGGDIIARSLRTLAKGVKAKNN